MFGSLKTIFWVGLGIAAALALTSAIAYVMSVESTKARMAKQIAVLESNEKLYLRSLEEQTLTIAYLEAEFERQRREYERVQEEFDVIREQNRDFRAQLEAMELAKTAAENPSAVEVIINENTRALSRCFELATGSPLTEDERNATDANEFNSACPWLFDEFRTR